MYMNRRESYTKGCRHGLTLHAQLDDAGGHLADDAQAHVGRVDAAMLGDVVGQTLDVDGLHLVHTQPL